MPTRRVLAGLLILAAGCGHRRLPRLPTPADIAEINDVALGDPAGIQLHYRDARPCPPGACTVESLRPVPEGPPSQVRRILSADQRRLAVLTDSGDVWTLDISKVAGASTHPGRRLADPVVGGLFGLVLGGLVAVSIGTLNQSGPDTSADPGAGHPLPVGAMIGTMVGFTVAGVVAGVLIDRQFPSVETFEFHDGDDAGPRR